MYGALVEYCRDGGENEVLGDILFQFSSFIPKPKWKSQDRTWTSAVGGRQLKAYF